MNEFELKILDWIQDTLHFGFLDPIMQVITHLGDAGIFWIAAALLLLIFRKTRPLGIAMAVALVIDLLCCNILLKPLIQRVRPYDVKLALDNVVIDTIIKRPTDFSFPSGHTAASFASAFALTFKKSKLALPAMILAILIAFSRLYFYVHYPTDVLGGILIGLFAGFFGAMLSVKLVKLIQKKFPKAI